MLTRREFLKLALSAFCVPSLTGIERIDIQDAPGQKWVFPLTFPAWFPVEPRIPDPLKHKVYAPIVREKDG